MQDVTNQPPQVNSQNFFAGELNGLLHVAQPSQPLTQGNAASIITVVRDPNHWLGKRFDWMPDGTVSKKSTVSLSIGLAVMHHAPTTAAFVKLLIETSEDPSAAIINAYFPSIETGEEFVILAEREIEKRLDIPASDRKRQQGIHMIEYNGMQIKAVGRFKENVRPSCWQLLDRDVDKDTPPEFAKLSDDDWMLALAKFLPGIDKVTTVHTCSSSSRVMHDGKPVGTGNGHVWIQVSNPEDVERLRTTIMVLAAQAEMTWLKPRHSRTEPRQVVGNSLTTIIDPSVLTPGRLVFVGKPTVSDGLTVEPLSPTIVRRQHETFDAASVVLPDAETVRAITKKAGVEMQISTGGNGLHIAVNDLTLETEVETKDHGVLTVQQMLERGIKEKTRCQTPFRASESFAAFYNVNADGKPYIYDSGTCITHWLDRQEWPALDVIKANSVIKELMPAIADDPSAILEDHAVAALATIQQNKSADYQRKRATLKQANSKVSLTALDMAVKAHTEEQNAMQTHHGYAENLLAELAVGKWKPVAFQGSLFVLNATNQLWESTPVDKLIRMVATRHDGKPNCERRSDYKAIAEHAISLASDDDFFAEAPIGIACPNGFYRVTRSEIIVEPLTPEHRQRVTLRFSPVEKAMPQFDAFLHETFASKIGGEENDQRILVQEIFGATLLGIMPRFQKAIQYYDAFGRAGKGTLMACQTELVPLEFVTAVSPFNWSKDYFVASLAGSRLNVVGELPDTESIPAAMFKTVIGGDLITGRHPTHRPITFRNEAAHVFMSNHLINTRDHTEAFYARWLIVEFPNSRLRSGLPLDSALASRIIEDEMPGIAFWALQGAIRLMDQGKFSGSCVHDRLMAKWRRTSNSLEEFIAEECVLVKDSGYRRSEFYLDYAKWCSENGRKAFAKGRVKELLEHNIGLGIRLVEVDGYETFRGVHKKPLKTQSRLTNRQGVPPAALDPELISTSLPDLPETLF